MLCKDPADAEIVILHVEDDDDDALLLRRALGRMRHQVYLERVVHGRHGVERLADGVAGRKPAIELVILDLNMPVMDGRAVLRWMRDEGGLPDLPVVVLTTLRDPEVLRDLCARGANAAISKDMDDADQSELAQVIIDLWFHGGVDALRRQLALVPANDIA